MRVLVCGGREYWDERTVFAVLDKLHKQRRITVVISGGALGADTVARNWCRRAGLMWMGFPADWKRFGRAAGLIRNSMMLHEGPDIVVAFPGGAGTADLVGKAKARGLPVIEVPDC